MTGAPTTEELPQAGRRRRRWPGLVWAIPAAALLIVAYLGIQALLHRGVVVTVTFTRAGEARPGDTKVLYQGVEIGHLIKIVPNEDGHRLDFKLRMEEGTDRYLNTNSRFWLIGATPNLDLSSLKAVVEGVAIGFAPGDGGSPTRKFEGLDSAPPVLPGDRGTRYRLHAHSLGSIQVGSALLFRGQSIGKVTDVEFKGEGGFRLDVFVFQPYDALIRAGDLFWKSSPVRLSFVGGGVDANLAPAATILSGGVDVEMPPDAHGPQSPQGTEFTLFADEGAARQGEPGPGVRYDLRFDAAGGLEVGAPVTLLGFPVGQVESIRLAYDPRAGTPYTAVTALIYPRQIDPAAPPSATDADRRAAADASLRRLLRLGYRARLSKSPALVGAPSIALAPVPGGGGGDLLRDGGNPRIPNAPGSGDLDEITAQLGQILAKVNRVPIEAIGTDLGSVASRLRRFSASPKLADGLAHFDSTMGELDAMLAQMQPQIGPLLGKLNDAAGQVSGIALAARRLLDGGGAAQDDSLPEAIRQLNEAARSIRDLADYLGRHPEALIRGKRPGR
jgi:paraquat-inducible protein B